MGIFYRDKDGCLTARATSSIKPTIKEAIELAKNEDGGSVSFDFNDIEITVEPNSNPDLILRDFWRALDGHIDKNVGPHPKYELSEEDQVFPK